jgi:segregation and condensation protein A
MAAMLAEIKSRMLLPRPPSVDGQDEDDPRAELVRRLQEYERFKKAAEDIDKLTRLERDTMPASAELLERKVVKIQPQVSLQEMLLAFKDVLKRADMFAHHHVSRERLSVRQRMSDILSTLREVAFLEFTQLFRAEEGRMGVTVTFIGILELMKEGLIEIVQAEAYAPIHVRTAQSARHLTVVQGGVTDADAENEAALAQPAHPDENDLPEDDEPELQIEETAAEEALTENASAASIESVADDASEVLADAEDAAAAIEPLADDASANAPDVPTDSVDEVYTEAATEVSTETIVEASADVVTEVSADVAVEASSDATDADLSTDDDSVTPESGETDNPEAEPSK